MRASTTCDEYRRDSVLIDSPAIAAAVRLIEHLALETRNLVAAGPVTRYQVEAGRRREPGQDLDAAQGSPARGAPNQRSARDRGRRRGLVGRDGRSHAPPRVLRDVRLGLRVGNLRAGYHATAPRELELGPGPDTGGTLAAGAGADADGEVDGIEELFPEPGVRPRRGVAAEPPQDLALRRAVWARRHPGGNAGAWAGHPIGVEDGELRAIEGSLDERFGCLAVGVAVPRGADDDEHHRVRGRRHADAQVDALGNRATAGAEERVAQGGEGPWLVGRHPSLRPAVGFVRLRGCGVEDELRDDRAAPAGQEVAKRFIVERLGDARSGAFDRYDLGLHDGAAERAEPGSAAKKGRRVHAEHGRHDALRRVVIEREEEVLVDQLLGYVARRRRRPDGDPLVADVDVSKGLHAHDRGGHFARGGD